MIYLPPSVAPAEEKRGEGGGTLLLPRPLSFGVVGRTLTCLHGDTVSCHQKLSFQGGLEAVSHDKDAHARTHTRNPEEIHEARSEVL